MWPSLEFPEDLVTFTEEILNGKLRFLCSDFQVSEAIESIEIKENIGTK